MKQPDHQRQTNVNDKPIEFNPDDDTAIAEQLHTGTYPGDLTALAQAVAYWRDENMDGDVDDDQGYVAYPPSEVWDWFEANRTDLIDAAEQTIDHEKAERDAALYDADIDHWVQTGEYAQLVADDELRDLLDQPE